MISQEKMEESSPRLGSSKQSYYVVASTNTAGLSTMWKATTVVAFLVAVGAIIIGAISFDQIAGLRKITDALASDSPLEIQYPGACRYLDKSVGSGLYNIRPHRTMLSFPVYCDMDTAGGGWTLVASIHENNIQGKCTPGDKWSSEEGSHSGNTLGSMNWENRNIFGRVEKATSDDYKNAAYFAMEGKDVMVWHVPNGQNISSIKKTAYLKYYTDNNFLGGYGGTLRDLYKNHARVFPYKESGLYPLLKQFNETVRSILNEVDNWHRYRYDDHNQIDDGDQDAYDVGNKVFFRINGASTGTNTGFTRLLYNKMYSDLPRGMDIFSATTYPFVAMAWVGKSSPGADQVNTFEYRVDSNFGADGQGTASFYHNTPVNSGQMRAQYTAFLIDGAAKDASICEVFFYIGSPELWNSTLPTHMDRLGWNLRDTTDARNTVRFSGGPSNVLLGYALLSREGARRVEPRHIENVLTRYMTLAESFQYRDRLSSISTPVKYEVGDNQQVLESIPTGTRASVDPGYIQFRAMNLQSATNAFCPGVRVRSTNSQQVCIGGGNSMQVDPSSCGDFSGWRGSPDDYGNATSPSSTGRSQKDINSSILIFVR